MLVWWSMEGIDLRQAEESEEVIMRDLACTNCGSSLRAVLEYVPWSYSEHRDFVGIECNNYSCLAEWYSDGTVKVEGKPTQV
jgi:hypothetical protein